MPDVSNPNGDEEEDYAGLLDRLVKPPITGDLWSAVDCLRKLPIGYYGLGVNISKGKASVQGSGPDVPCSTLQIKSLRKLIDKLLVNYVRTLVKGDSPCLAEVTVSNLESSVEIEIFDGNDTLKYAPKHVYLRYEDIVP